MEITMDKLANLIDERVKSVLKTQAESNAEIDSELAKKDPDPEAVLARNPDTIQRATLTQERKDLIGGVLRALAATQIIEVSGATTLERACKIAKDIYHDDAVAKTLELQDFVSGGALVSEERLPGMIELLRAMSVVRGMNPVIIPMPNGSTSISKMTGGATATYIGESSNIVPSEQTFGLVRFSDRKLAALTPVSNDLLRAPSASANMVVQDDLSSALGLRSDLAFIRGDGTEFTPRGMESWVTTAATFSANATVNLANVTADLGTAILNLENQNVRMLRPGWLMAPRTRMYLATIRDGNGNYAYRDEILAGRLWGFPVGVTTQIPINLGGGTESLVFFADFADMVIAEAMDMQIDATSTGAYHDGSAVQSAFSLDETVIRAIERHDFGVRHDESISLIDTVKWIP